MDHTTFIKDVTFCSSVASIVHMYGWEILKSPFQTKFAKYSSYNVGKYCIFLKMVVSSYMKRICIQIS